MLSKLIPSLRIVVWTAGLGITPALAGLGGPYIGKDTEMLVGTNGMANVFEVKSKYAYTLVLGANPVRPEVIAVVMSWPLNSLKMAGP